MKLPIIILITLFSTMVFSQKFAVIENKGDNAKYFNYKDPNSFVGVLMNNLVLIPEMAASTQFQGVYDEYTLESLSISKESMLTFEVADRFTIYNPTFEQTIELIKTNQSLDVFLDSLKPILDYEELFLVDRNILQKYWDKSNIGSFLYKYQTYYFDIRNISAFLLEEKEKEVWIHFIKQNANGKNFISLSLKKDQLMESSCFNFWKFLTDEESKEFIATFKSEAFEQLNTKEFNLWSKGTNPLFYMMNEEIQFNVTSCWDSPEKIKLKDNVQSPFSMKDIDTKKIQKTIKTQELGTVVHLERFDFGDEVTLFREEGSLKDFLKRIEAEVDIELLFIIQPDLEKLWDATEIGAEVRKSTESLVVWKEIPNAKTAISYTIDTKNRSKFSTNVNSAVMYLDENYQKIAYLDYNKESQSQQFPLTNSLLDKIEIDISNISDWNSLIYTKTMSNSYTEIQKALNLINNSTNLN
jgi:hypothetical protein